MMDKNSPCALIDGEDIGTGGEVTVLPSEYNNYQENDLTTNVKKSYSESVDLNSSCEFKQSSSSSPTSADSGNNQINNKTDQMETVESVFSFKQSSPNLTNKSSKSVCFHSITANPGGDRKIASRKLTNHHHLHLHPTFTSSFSFMYIPLGDSDEDVTIIS